MRTPPGLIGLLAAGPLLVASCTPLSAAMLEPVGPASDAKESANGVLRVYTATDEVSTEGPIYFSGYRVFFGDGTLYRDIHSNGSIDLSNHDPRSVTLPAGKYFVDAQNETRTLVRVPVVIETGKLTVVR